MAGSGDGWSWTPEWGLKGGGRKEDVEAGRRWEVETDGKRGCVFELGDPRSKDPMNLDTIEYCLIFHSRFTQWA